jgi:hypothetical protein
MDESLRPLLRRFKPDLYFGFDIYPGMLDGMTDIDDTVCVFSRRAAWTKAGTLGVKEQGNCTGVMTDYGDDDNTVASFDLGGFLYVLPAPVVLKIDVEGAEYPILWNLYSRGIDKGLERILVEWHTEELAHGLWQDKRPPLRCPVEEWG